MANRTGAQLLVDVLRAQATRRVFCVPGESYLAVLDALGDAQNADAIDTIVCRHEASAANMAEATGKLTGRPGICFVTRGPGATQASVGVHTAFQDSTPMILFIGQVARGDKGREAFQEVDHAAFFGPLAKWAVEIDDAARVPELVERAFAVAMQGRMGPVVIALPEDMLVDEVEAHVGARIEPARTGLAAGVADDIGEALAGAERPLLVVGGSGWDEEGRAAIGAFAQANDLPVISSWRRRDLIDNGSPLFVGEIGLSPNPKLVARVKQADLVICVGARLGENPSQGYTLLTREETARRLIHIHPSAEEIGRVWPVRLGAAAHASEAARALASVKVPVNWSAWRADARNDYEAFSTPVSVTGPVNPSELVAHMDEVLPEDAVFTNGAGNFAVWLHRFHKHRAWKTQVAPTSGAMGYGYPASIAASLEYPDRPVICVAGDGDFMMAAAEMATVVRHGAKPIVVVLDNSAYGTIRAHQERQYPARVHATELVNPDFAAMARSFGLWAGTVEKTEDFAAAFAQARENAPALVHVKMSIEDIAPGRTIAAIRKG